MVSMLGRLSAATSNSTVLQGLFLYVVIAPSSSERELQCFSIQDHVHPNQLCLGKVQGFWLSPPSQMEHACPGNNWVHRQKRMLYRRVPHCHHVRGQVYTYTVSPKWTSPSATPPLRRSLRMQVTTQNFKRNGGDIETRIDAAVEE